MGLTGQSVSPINELHIQGATLSQNLRWQTTRKYIYTHAHTCTQYRISLLFIKLCLKSHQSTIRFCFLSSLFPFILRRTASPGRTPWRQRPSSVPHPRNHCSQLTLTVFREQGPPSQLQACGTCAWDVKNERRPSWKTPGPPPPCYLSLSRQVAPMI